MESRGDETNPPAHRHLESVTSERGFRRFPAIPSTYVGEVRAYESSAALHPCVWLSVWQNEGFDLAKPRIEAVAHLTAEDAWYLAEQLITLVLRHYHGDVRPPRDRRYVVATLDETPLV